MKNTDYKYMELINNTKWTTSKTWKCDYSFDKLENKNCLLFQGSIEKEDWILDFLPLVLPFWLYKKFIVAAGWAIAWKEIKNEVLNKIDKNILDLYIVGHSYGSAMAVLAGEAIKYKYPNINLHLITFGSVKPLMTGVKHFKKCFVEIKQYCHRGDFVVWLSPFLWRRLNTIWIGKSKNIFKTNKYHNDYANPEYY